jgi:hypothetical protein
MTEEASMYKADPTNTIAIRSAAEDDARALRRLAALDSAATLEGPVLMAEVDGEPRAAFAVRSGESIADPFFPSAPLVDLLRLRASLLTGQAGAAARRVAARSHLHVAASR